MKRQTKAKNFFKCEFCKKVVEIGQFYIHTKERDNYGSFEIRRHIECDRTAVLNDAADKAWW